MARSSPADARPTAAAIPRRETLAAIGVLTVLWALAVHLGGHLPVLWVSLAAAVAVGSAAAVLLARRGARLQVGHDVWLALPVAAAHLAVSYVAIPVATALVPLVGEQADTLVLDARALPTVVVALIAGVAIAPLEELFWRGAVQPSLGAGRAPLVATGIGTAAFMTFHLPTLQLPLIGAALLGGLAWGWLRERTGGLAAPLVAHAIWTSAMVVVPPA